MTEPDIPVIRTERLTLRAPKISDFEAYAAFRASERTAHVGGPMDRETAFDSFSALIGHWSLRGFGRWIVADSRSDAPLGYVGPYFPEDWPEPEIAWTVFAGAEGRGVAFEAAQAARAYAYGTLGWTTAISLTTPGNARSMALAQRMGCVREGEFAHQSMGPLLVWRHPGPDAPNPETPL
ncbi:GNAT family N-acetyltransferase [Rubrimonas cliftonensis]|uniref:Ribosomal-protein-alanine N-acetyltransferase n=1 Tax=Rubrimonas cliftonensis TaxID=89524 RepID=A0A1H3VGA4_9RHOB|nr:GNAT family N-acetyltransferase [Rubrimonas cliftonensis]SDZ73823.1 ribosomal-protein-alanine N-acetyltransferase [Rubrimonas cliftonensis]